MTNSPIPYTSRTFQTVMADINSDPLLVDKPDWIKRLIAGDLDVLSNIENASANQAYLRTAFSAKAVFDIAAMLGYNVPGLIESSGTLMFDLAVGVGLPYTAMGTLAALYGGSILTPSKRFEARTSLTFGTANCGISGNQAYSETPANAAWNLSTFQATVSAGAYVTGEKLRVANAGGALPTGITAGTDYFAIYVDATHIQLASSRVNAFLGVPVQFTAQGTGSNTITRYSRAIAAYQQTSGNQVAFSSDGVTPWQTFNIGQQGVLKSNLAVTVNGVTWTSDDAPALWKSTDMKFQFLYNSDGSASIRFGDGTFGALPSAGSNNIIAAFSYGGGSLSNVAALNAITVYAGSDPNITGAFNPVAFTGGQDAQSTTITKILAPALLKSRSRFITQADGIALALAYGGLGQCQVLPNYFGILTMGVLGIAAGGEAEPSGTYQSNLVAYLQGLTITGGPTVAWVPGAYVAENLTLNVHVASGFSWANIQNYVKLATYLYFSPAGNQIYNDYSSTGGIIQAVADINAIFGFSFTTADYSVVQTILSSFTPRQYGDLLQLSNFYDIVQNVPGVGYCALAAGDTMNLAGNGYYQLAANAMPARGAMTFNSV